MGLEQQQQQQQLVRVSAISLFLSPKVPANRATVLREVASAKSSYVRIVDSEEDAIHVLPTFDPDDVSSLVSQGCRVVGLPFAERLVHDPSLQEKVNALPLYDFILPPETTVTHSGLPPAVRLRCQELTRWMGAKTSEELSADTGILITARVSLHPKSKYQAALALRLPIVKPAFLEAAWTAKERVAITSHALPALEGLGVCIDNRYQDEIKTYSGMLSDHGAVIETLDRAEVVIVKDIFAPLYKDAKNIGLLCATPLWLDRCFEVGRCVPISGELDVPKTRYVSLVRSCDSLASFGGATAFENECNACLMGCVLCLSYLSVGHDQKYAKALAWKCGAWTTWDPLDRAITHVLFKVIGKVSASVSMPVDEDRISFLDVSWLEACAREGRRSSEQLFPRQLVNHNPVSDVAHAAMLGRMASAPSKQRATPSLQRRMSEKHTEANGPQSSAAIATVSQPPAPQQVAARASANSSPEWFAPTSTEGVFAGLKLGLFGGQSKLGLEREQGLVPLILSKGAWVARGTCEALSDASTDFCVCCDFCFQPSVVNPKIVQQLVTISWVHTCVQDQIKHPPTYFPHFQPSRGVLPIPEMASCALRLTAVEASANAHQGQRKRALLEELAILLGAKVVDSKAKWSDITHMVCVLPELLDPKQHEIAVKKSKPIVKVQWLFDCYKMGSWQPEGRYEIKAAKRMSIDSPGKINSMELKQRTVAVLDGYAVFISPCALGSDDKLPLKAEELGAKVHTWRNADELRLALAACGIKFNSSNPNTASDNVDRSSERNRNVVVLVEREEAATTEFPIAGCISDLPTSLQNMFVLPSWLAETHSQRRSLPLEAFAALPVTDAAERDSKRQKTGEAMYAWQSAASTQLTELAEDSRARALQCKQQQKISEGLRLADLRREAPSAPR